MQYIYFSCKQLNTFKRIFILLLKNNELIYFKSMKLKENDVRENGITELRLLTS